MIEEGAVISSFMFNSVASRLNNEAGDALRHSLDKTYAEHKKKEQEERAEFLEWAVPAFFAGFRTELIKEAEELNRYLIREEDRVKVHVSQDTLRDALITSNIEDTKWFNDEVSLEVASGCGEIIETYRCFSPEIFREIEVTLIVGFKGALRVVAASKSYSISEYAHHLNRTLSGREANST